MRPYQNLTNKELLSLTGKLYGVRSILGSNPKTEKGAEKTGVLIGIVHLKPYRYSFETDRGAVSRNTCPHANSCIKFCLNEAGNPAYNSVKFTARENRTRLYWMDRDLFLELLVREIARLERRAAKLGMAAAVRLNGTSDILWEKVARWIFDLFPEVTFYDYTKFPYAKRNSNTKDWPSNYSLTYSFDGLGDVHHEWDRLAALTAGENVAVAFDVRKTEDLPATFFGWPVINGDTSDYRPGDGVGVVVGLIRKQNTVDRSLNAEKTSFFVDPAARP